MDDRSSILGRGRELFLRHRVQDWLWGPTSLLSNGTLSPGVKWPGREADHSPPSSTEVKNAWSYNSTSRICLHGFVLSKGQGQLCLLLAEQ
jgi:hypothetical protein